MQDFFVIGQVVKPQGVKGELKVKVLSEDALRFNGLKSVFINENDSFEEISLEKTDTRDDYAYVTIKGVYDRNAAEKFRNEFLYVARESAIKLEQGRYFISDLEGMQVFTDSGKQLGTLKEILQTGSADIYCVKGPKNLMFPALSKLILDVDVKGNRITVSEAVLEEVAVYED